MPKLKTKKAMKKRYRVTPGGKVLAKKSFTRHLLTDRSPKKKRQNRRSMEVEPMYVSAIKRCLPYDH